MDNEELINEIELLIASNREGDYWDFKEKYHSNKADLLHDIICMANNRADRDAYIIFGVSNDFEVVGLEGDLNRRNQQNIIDFLRTKKFSGGIRPIIELKSLYIHGKEVDILIVKNSTDTPYFLIADFPERGRTARANHIYTRVGDTNTPINDSADINHVEYLWKKRFLLNRPPLEQIQKRLINKKEWKSEGDTYYNIFNPEFTIQLRGNEDYDHGKPEFYSYLMMNESTSFGDLIVSCFGTTLYDQQYVVLDGGRYLTVIPKWGFIGNQFRWEETFAYKYFIKGNLDYTLHLFLLDEDNQEALWAKDRLYSGTIIYNSELERELFEVFLNQNEGLIIKAIEKDKDSYNWLECSEDLEKQDATRKIKTGMAFKGLLEDFRRSGLRQETLL